MRYGGDLLGRQLINIIFLIDGCVPVTTPGMDLIPAYALNIWRKRYKAPEVGEASLIW